MQMIWFIGEAMAKYWLWIRPKICSFNHFCGYARHNHSISVRQQFLHSKLSQNYRKNLFKKILFKNSNARSVHSQIKYTHSIHSRIVINRQEIMGLNPKLVINYNSKLTFLLLTHIHLFTDEFIDEHSQFITITKCMSIVHWT